MKSWIVLGLVMGSALLLPSGLTQVSAQVCKDDEGMVTEYKKTMTDFVETVKKESLVDFEKNYHRKNVATKLMLFGNAVDGLISCLQKSANDPATLKADADAAKSKIEVYNKVKDAIKQHRDALKAAQTDKEAKALIEKFAFTG